MDSTELLNKVQRKIIDFANSEGISLQGEFGSVDNFKKFVVAFTIKSLVDAGTEIDKAYDMVFGSGAYNTLAETVWEASQHGERGDSPIFGVDAPAFRHGEETPRHLCM